MLKLSKILIGLFALFPYVLTAQTSDKKSLCCDVVRSAKTFDNLADVLNIICQYDDIYGYIPSIHPIQAKNQPRISSYYGYRTHPIDSVRQFHAGIDIVAEYATTIHATATGKVVFAGYKGGYGKTIIIEHNYGFKTVYAHLTEFYTEAGKEVEKGQIIGFLGNTGKSTGSHLHYEIIKNGIAINPFQFINIIV